MGVVWGVTIILGVVKIFRLYARITFMWDCQWKVSGCSVLRDNTCALTQGEVGCGGWIGVNELFVQV